MSSPMSSPMSSIVHLAIRCRNLERSRHFFETAIGWKFVGARAQGQALDLTDGRINITLIQQPEDWQPAAPRDGDEQLHFGVLVDDIEACRQRLEEWGAEFAAGSIKAAGDEHDGPQQSFKVLDPDGNIIDVTSNRNEWRGVSV